MSAIVHCPKLPKIDILEQSCSVLFQASHFTRGQHRSEELLAQRLLP